MAKKSKPLDEFQQLSLLEIENNSNFETSDDDWLSGDFGFDGDNDRTIETKGELLTLKLLKEFSSLKKAIKASLSNVGSSALLNFASKSFFIIRILL